MRKIFLIGICVWVFAIGGILFTFIFNCTFFPEAFASLPTPLFDINYRLVGKPKIGRETQLVISVHTPPKLSKGQVDYKLRVDFPENILISEKSSWEGTFQSDETKEFYLTIKFPASGSYKAQINLIGGGWTMTPPIIFEATSDDIKIISPNSAPLKRHNCFSIFSGANAKSKAVRSD
jgi:hypothetical protein